MHFVLSMGFGEFCWSKFEFGSEKIGICLIPNSSGLFHMGIFIIYMTLAIKQDHSSRNFQSEDDSSISKVYLNISINLSYSWVVQKIKTGLKILIIFRSTSCLSLTFSCSNYWCCFDGTNSLMLSKSQTTLKGVSVYWYLLLILAAQFINLELFCSICPKEYSGWDLNLL